MATFVLIHGSWHGGWCFDEVRARLRGTDSADYAWYLFDRERVPGKVYSSDMVLEIEQADVYLEGYLKWDGCAELDQGRHHWCDEQDFIKHAMLLNYLWQRAHQLMENSDYREETKPKN